MFIPISHAAIEGNFVITGGKVNGTNTTDNINANFYAVYGINVGFDGSFSLTVVDDTPIITIIYPLNGTTVTRTDPIELTLEYTSPLGSSADIEFIDYLNQTVLCTNNSVASGSTVRCGVSLMYGDTFQWYVNATNYYADEETGVYYFFVRELGDTGYFAVLILLPVIFGIFILIGTITMGKDHDVLKFMALPLSLFSVIASMHFASLVVNNTNPSLSALQDQMGRTVYWMGWMIVVLIIYILMYAFYKITDKIAKQKEENLRY